MNENPSYYAILSADVRYDKRLRANEKLLYAEITALTNKTGACWASNKYFAELYGVTTQAVSKWINDLKNCGYISVSYEMKGREIDKRVIRLASTNVCDLSINDEGVSTNVSKVSTNVDGGYQQKIKENSTRENITSNNTDEYIGQSPKAQKEPQHKYGEYQNVLLSDTDYGKLVNEFPSDYQERIERLSSYMASTGKSYKNHLATIRNWARRDGKQTYQKPTRQQPRPNDAIPDYDKDNIYKENGELDLEAMALNFWNK